SHGLAWEIIRRGRGGLFAVAHEGILRKPAAANGRQMWGTGLYFILQKQDRGPSAARSVACASSRCARDDNFQILLSSRLFRKSGSRENAFRRYPNRWQPRGLSTRAGALAQDDSGL